MTNWQLIHRIQRVLGVSSPEKRDPWAKGALALCAVTLGLAALMPVRAYSRPAHQNPPVTQDTTVKVVTKIQLNINGDKIELNTTDLTPETPVKINDKLVRFGDLNATQQQQLQEAVQTIHIESDMHNVKVLMHKGDDPNSPTSSKVIVSKSSVTHILLNITGDKIELNTTNLKPDTLLKVNGKEGRFSDLTPQQQKELQQALKNVHVAKSKHDIEVRMYDGSAPGSANSSKVIVSKGGATKILMSINGDKIELNTLELTPDTPVKVNGKEGRFGDLTPKQQEQLQEAVKGVHIHVVPDTTLVGPHAGTTFASATIQGGHPKILVKVNGDTVEITGNSNDFSTENLPADTLVKINGKESRFGDLPESEQKAIRETKASVHVNVSSDAKQTVPPAPAPDKP